MTGLLKHSYTFSVILFLIFITNIVIGRVSTSVFDRQLPLGLTGVYEFLILFLACLFFVAGILRSEANTQS
jgi:hypothetical protein